MTTTAALLALAMLLDARLGEPDWLWSRLPHPAVLMGRAVAALDRALNRGRARRAKVVLAALILSGGAIGLGWVLTLAGPVAEIVAAAILLAQRSLVEHVQAVATGLRAGRAQGQYAVSMIVSRETAPMHPPDVARAAIESAAENLSDGVIAPAFWFLIAGLPGLLLYKVINTADSMIGYRTTRYEAFGWAAARSDDLLNLVPARLTALLLGVTTATFGPLGEIFAEAARHKSPNAGWPEAVMARALNIALAGPRHYDGALRDLPWVNPAGQRDIGAEQIERSTALLWRAWAAALAIVIAIAMLLAVV